VEFNASRKVIVEIDEQTVVAPVFLRNVPVVRRVEFGLFFGIEAQNIGERGGLDVVGFRRFVRSGDDPARLSALLAAASVPDLLTTVFAMARTSSRLKAMGLEGALRFKILLRRADFLVGFSMMAVTRLAAGADWAFFAGPGAGLRKGLADLGACLFADLFFLFFAMGRIGEGLERIS
jgi:hypothetical protein